MTQTITLQDCRAMDADDPLRHLRSQFTLPEGVIYLDGNSLGVLPKTVARRLAAAITDEWGQGLIRSWNSAGWVDLPQRLGDKIAQLIGAGPGEVVATDSTSVNLYKVLNAALNIARADAPGRRLLVSERSNFPTDLYIAEALCKERQLELRLVDSSELLEALTPEVAVLMLTHVNYRTGAMHDMAALTAAAHAAGALTVWDLAHSAGAVPIELNHSQADFAVGCSYKYLNGGPGAPAFVWVAPRHADRFWQPLAGWWGHAAPFEFTPEYRPAAGIGRYLCGTQPILSLIALECGLDSVLAALPVGGMQALRRKSLLLTDLFIELVEGLCTKHGLGLVTPRPHAERGSQICLSSSEGAYAMVQALMARGVVGDFRAGSGDPSTGSDQAPSTSSGRTGSPDILRFGFTPLYIGFEDVWHAVEHLKQVLEAAEWTRPEFNQKHAVT